MASEIVIRPDGTKMMVQPTDSLASRLDFVEEAQSAASAELTAKRLQAVADKKARQQSGDALPSDKSVL